MSFRSFGIQSKATNKIKPLRSAPLAEFSSPTYDQAQPSDEQLSEGQIERETEALQASGAKKAEAGDFSGAIKMWNRALDYSPGRSALHEMKAQVLLEVGQIWEAVQSASKAVDASPEWPEAHLTLARAQLALGEPESALNEMEEVLKLQPGHSEATEEISNIRMLVLKRQQDPGGAQQRLKVV